MKFSYQWLRELTGGLDTSPKEVGRLITMKTAECDGVEEAAPLLAQASWARVVSAEPVGAGHNRKAVVETARYGTKTVVCGAPNCRAGMRTLYLPLAAKTIDGILSEGILASGAELGINRDDSGIVEQDGDVPLDPDWIIEIDNKSLTHRPDLWGHFGMAREVAAITGVPLRDPVFLDRLPQAPAVMKISIDDFSLCPRYSALVFENVTVLPSPLWLQYRLESVGLNPINNIVDVTNFIMAELAQPMHAFDADKLRGAVIHARPARAGERIAALNNESYGLTCADLVIADADGPIAIAGIIGGLDTAIGAGTTRIVLESASFQAASIRKTSSRLRLRTDASIRFEKAQDPVNTVRALARAIGLLEEVSPGIRMAGGLADSWQPAPPPAPIELPLDWLDCKLGRAIPASEVRRILEALSFGVADTAPRIFSVAVPTWRATKDVSIADDLVEEVGRMIGYDSIPPIVPRLAATVPPANPERVFHHRVRDLVSAQGFTEVYNYSFLSEETARRFQFDPAAHIAVSNPISSEQGLLRLSLVPGIWKNILDNARHFDSFRLFEIGREIHKQAQGLPREIPHLAAAIYAKDSGVASLYELKRLAECLGVTRVRPTAPRPFEHPHRSAEVCIDDHPIARLFEFHPSMIETGRAAVLDLDLALLLQLAAPDKKLQPLRRFPASVFDLSIVTDVRHLVGDMQDQIAASAGPSLIAIEYLRQYTGAPLPDGSKSVSFRLTIGAPDHTLSSSELTAFRTHIIDALRALHFDLRV
ncbi:MAG: phenylalanine--tRNA ligase subunit beta [Bryobacteraceae bacterium]